MEQCFPRDICPKQGSKPNLSLPLKGCQQAAIMGQKGARCWVRSIMSHDGNLCILNSALEQKIPTIWIRSLLSATKRTDLCLVGPLARKTWGYWVSKYLGQEEAEKWVSCKQAISICCFLSYLKTFTLFWGEFMPCTFRDNQFTVMVGKRQNIKYLLLIQTPQTQGKRRKKKGKE